MEVASSKKFYFGFLAYIVFYKIIYKVKKVYNKTQLFAWETKITLYSDLAVTVSSRRRENTSFPA